MIQDTIDNKLTTEELVSKLTDQLNENPDKDDIVDALADTFVQIDAETCYGDNDRRELLLNVIKSTINAKIIPTSIALERFEVDTLAQLGQIRDKKQFTVSYNRLRTRLYFKQKKYNLLREENEGFAKILTELGKLTPNNREETVITVIKIIGNYHVDPNRVLDLVLEVFEVYSRSDYETYIDFLNSFYNNSQKITQIIILKLNFYANYKNEFSGIPSSFYRLIAILIMKEIIDLDDIYPLLTPSDSQVLDYHKKLVEEGRHLAKKYAFAEVGEERPVTKSVIDSLSDQERYVLELDNQKINLCAHLLDIGAWDNALMLARNLPQYYCFSHRRVARSACNLINYLIDPIYRESALSKPLISRVKPLSSKKFDLEQIKTVTDLQKRLFPMLVALGPFLNTLVLTKIIRILRYTLLLKHDNQDAITSESPLYYQILDVINDSILPSTSLSGSNRSLALELWTLLKNFKYPVRYKLYYNWRDETSNPTLLRNRGQVLSRAKHDLNRLSKSEKNLEYVRKQITKLCHCNPVITLNYVLIQVQSYDNNLIGAVVDALRFLTPLAQDTLVYCIIEALSDPHKNKKSFDGMAIAPWLISLSSFSATFIHRYKIEFTGFLEYITNQLKAGNSLDLILLTDVIQKMTGIETIQAITDDRIEALMGGDVLRAEGAYFNQVKDTRESSSILKGALIESGLAMPLCILIAQLRDSLFFNQSDGTPLKLVGKLYDQCQETLIQYGVFLSMNLSIDDYINFLPPLDKLMTDHKLDPDAAFFLARPMIFHRIKSKFLELKKEAAQEMAVEEGEAPELSFQGSGIKYVQAAKFVIDPIVTSIQPLLLEKYGTSNLSPKLFVIFWMLSMSDIEVPTNCYGREIQRLKTTVSEIGKSYDDPKRRKEKDRCNSLIAKLKQEEAEQMEHVAYIKMYLESEKNNLFCDGSGYENVYLQGRQFVQHCPYARSVLSAYDAIYSARFLLYLHELKVEDYPTIICLDRLLCDLTYMMGACTENEAHHYGRFLRNILKTTTLWHSDASIYNEQCEHYPGSIINTYSERITYDNYRDICYKWHYRLTRAFTVALESNNYIQTRNALIVMISIIEYYPAIKHFGKGIGIKIEEVRSNEKGVRQDLYALATAYAVRLHQKKPHLIPESSFHTVDVRKKGDTPNNSKSGSNSSKKEASDSKNTSNHSETQQSQAQNQQPPPKQQHNHSEHVRSSSSSRPSSKTRPRSPDATSHRERHSSSSSRKRARHD